MSYVLVVEPDAHERERMEKALLGEGLSPLCVESAPDALKHIDTELPEAVVIEMFLEHQSGFALCRALREREDSANLAVLMMTASTADLDRILAFEAGADDVMQRPLSTRELALRVRAVIRRSKREAERGLHPLTTLQSGPLELDTRGRSASVGGSDMHLTEREFEILALLMRRPGRVFRREEILAEIWGDARDPTSRAVDTHVKGIRRKLGDHANLLESLRGVGYRIADRLEAE